MDALYFRVSTDRQNVENQFAELLAVAERDGSERDWTNVKELLSRVIIEERTSNGNGERIRYSVNPKIAERLAALGVYVEQGRSAKSGAKRRPMFERMKKDASKRLFDRLLVYKVTRIGRSMREVISTAYELTDLGVTIVPLKSQVGPLHTSMGKLLWAINAWYAEMENDERSETIKAGHAYARRYGTRSGKPIGRPGVKLDAAEVLRLDEQGMSIRQIAAQLKSNHGNVYRVLKMARAALSQSDTEQTKTGV